MSVFAEFAAELDRLEAPFVVGGSLASSVRGVPRSTIDVDLVVRIGLRQVAELAESLGSGWYVDVDQAREAIRHGRAFNILHPASGLKFDLFPATTAFRNAEINRATIEPLDVDGEIVECPVATAEDILLAKLRWYADGGCVSEKQWSDIVGIVRMNPSLDRAYATDWAKEMDVADLLDRAIADSAR